MQHRDRRMFGKGRIQCRAQPVTRLSSVTGTNPRRASALQACEPT
jgi:hypothetical protein